MTMHLGGKNSSFRSKDKNPENTMSSKVTNPFGPITDRRQSPLSRFQSVLFHPVTLWLWVWLANAAAVSLLLFHWTCVPDWIPWDKVYTWHPLILSAVLCLNLWACPRLRS